MEREERRERTQDCRLLPFVIVDGRGCGKEGEPKNVSAE